MLLGYVVMWATRQEFEWCIWSIIDHFVVVFSGSVIRSDVWFFLWLCDLSFIPNSGQLQWKPNIYSYWFLRSTSASSDLRLRPQSSGADRENKTWVEECSHSGDGEDINVTVTFYSFTRLVEDLYWSILLGRSDAETDSINTTVDLTASPKFVQAIQRATGFCVVSSSNGRSTKDWSYSREIATNTVQLKAVKKLSYCGRVSFTEVFIGFFRPVIVSQHTSKQAVTWKRYQIDPV